MELMRRGLQQRHRLFFLGFALVYFGKVRGGLHRRRGAQRAALAGPGGARGAVWCRRPPRRRPPRSPPPHQLRKGGGVGGGGGCQLTLVYLRSHAYAHVHEQMRQISLDGSNIPFIPHPLDSLFLAPLARPLARARHFCATFFFSYSYSSSPPPPPPPPPSPPACALRATRPACVPAPPGGAERRRARLGPPPEPGGGPLRVPQRGVLPRPRGVHLHRRVRRLRLRHAPLPPPAPLRFLRDQELRRGTNNYGGGAGAESIACW